MAILSTIHGPDDVKKLSNEECNALAREIRQTIIDTVSRQGGHLASNLGNVELTIALHRAFNSPVDKLLFDVGHQIYTHKLLTGRQELFASLRSYHGMSGFPCRAESEHDLFDTGHSSTAISMALGLARARDLQNEDYHVVAVVGDGA
ncbi:MAG: 1-deoxy-D-xylulose-5-phosphate synthase, partial [Clostridia bacterium]|nr:1-deoxy-D-xylulose-5-phosphate synthase [Clostridia bacterium]